LINPSSRVGNTFLIDTLVALNIAVKKIFVPEHGFRGEGDAGEKIPDNTDTKTGLPIISLYGHGFKPAADDLQDIDIVVFDIQDVGVRFYTYIATMHYMMEACAENKVSFLVLDRPNPNGFYVDGPRLEPEFKSLTGLHPVPVVHGMTVAEFAWMINEEYWLIDSLQCDLQLIKCKGYDHNYLYKVPVNPSPNLRNMTAIYLYPLLCLFEGTSISVGRGTDNPFTMIGHPKYPDHSFSFVPESSPGAKNPKFLGKTCYGKDLSNYPIDSFVLAPALLLDELIEFYNKMASKGRFFFPIFLTFLSGNNRLRTQIIDGIGMNEIRNSWQEDLVEYKKLRKKYLLYKDFE